MSESTVSIDGTELASVALEGVGVIDGSKFVYANDVLAEMHGYDRGRDLVGTKWEELVEITDQDTTARELLADVREEGEWRGRVAGQKLDGDTVPVELSLGPSADGIVCIARELSDRVELERELDRYETILDTVDDGVYVLNEDLRVEMANERFFKMLSRFGFSREEVLEMHAHDLVVKEDERAALEATIEQAIRSESHTGSFEMSAETPDGDRIVCESRFRLYPEPKGGHRGCIGILRDVTDRKERERRLQRQRDELDTLNRINGLLLAVLRDLFESPREGEIEQTVCNRLADSDLYQFAWIGKPEVDGNRLVPEALAGVDEEYIQSVTVTTDAGATGQGPGGRAFRTGTIQVSHDIETDPTFEPWREAALERNIRSAAAVPLTYDATTYGILAVYASRPLAFSQREQRGFEILGEAIGHAINATRTRQLLFAEQVVELELQFTDPDEFLIDVADHLGCGLSLEGYVSTSDGAWLVYFALSGVGAERFVSVACEATPVETARSIGENDGDQLVMLRMDSMLLDSIAALGGKITSASIEDGRGTLVVEVSQSTDISEFFEQIRTTYPGTELLAKRDERSVELSSWPGEDGLVDLTDRQRHAIEAAYHAGYFHWPRESSAEEVADLLGISRPTLQAHLRKAEHELLATFLDGSE